MQEHLTQILFVQRNGHKMTAKLRAFHLTVNQQNLFMWILQEVGQQSMMMTLEHSRFISLFKAVYDYNIGSTNTHLQ